MVNEFSVVDTYELMELMFPKLNELRPLENSHDMEDFQYYQAAAERILKAGYRKCQTDGNQSN